MTIQVGKGESSSGTYKVDAKKDPAEIDFSISSDKDNSKMLGLYKVDGDTLTLCFVITLGEKAERPTKIESPAGSNIWLMTFKRAKK